MDEFVQPTIRPGQKIYIYGHIEDTNAPVLAEVIEVKTRTVSAIALRMDGMVRFFDCRHRSDPKAKLFNDDIKNNRSCGVWDYTEEHRERQEIARRMNELTAAIRRVEQRQMDMPAPAVPEPAPEPDMEEDARIKELLGLREAEVRLRRKPAKQTAKR